MSESKEKETVTATARIKSIADDEKSHGSIDAVQLEVSGTINTANATVEAAKRCIIFVIDKSGSMGGTRINTVREAVIPFIEEFCENENIMLKLILFESSAISHDIPNDRNLAKSKLESILHAGGGTDFARASDTLVSVAQQVLTNYANYEMTVIICSDGEVSKTNAQQAHATWKSFVNSKYMKIHKQFPFVESIGISSNHDADILDGFILNDDNGNYTRANDANAIRESFERAAENATMRQTYKIRLSSDNKSGILFIDSLYNGNNLKFKEYTLTQTDFLLKVWINKKSLISTNQNEDLYIFINEDTKVKVTMCEISDKGKVQEYIIDFYHQILKDMINILRNIQDENVLKTEAEKIQNSLEKSASTFVSITGQPAELAKLESELKKLLDNCENDVIEERALTLKHYKKVRKSWKGHKIIVNQFNSTLGSLKELLQEILTGKTRMQEIRQHILDLHFSKKHAKRMNKLILTSEDLMKRQAMYDNICELQADDVKEMSSELGSGCFLSQMTLLDCALDGEALWVCGRVSRVGGAMVSNPEIIRIEYISPDLVSNEYFQMAMDICQSSPSQSVKMNSNISDSTGFLDGSRNIINARLFPIYGGNVKYLQISKPYLFETLSHTLSGRNDIRINDFSTLSAVLGFMIATHKQTTNNLLRIFKDILPSYIMLAKYVKVYPYANEKNKEIDFKSGNKIELFELFNARLRRYCNKMQVRCNSLITNVQCLFGDALLTNSYSLLLGKPIIWFSMLAQRLRSLIKKRIPGDQSLFTQAREAEINHAQALRILIRGTDFENDVFDDIKEQDEQHMYGICFENQYEIQKELKKERKSPFDIAECKSLKHEEIDFSAYDPYKITPSQIELCAQILSRIHFKDLIQALRFFKILNQIKTNENENDILKNIDKFKFSEEKNIPHTLTDLCNELGYKLSIMTLRALCGFSLLIQSNSLFQNVTNYGLFEELISKPSVILQHLHEKVIAESKRKPRRMVARIKNKPTSPIDLSIRHRHNNIVPLFFMDKKAEYWKKDISCLSSLPQFNICMIGSHDSGKSTLIGRLLFDLNAVSAEVYKKKQNDKRLNKYSSNEFAKIINNYTTHYEPSVTVIKSKDSSSIIRINDANNPKFLKNVIKTFGINDSFILCVPSPQQEFEQSIKKINKTLSHCMKALKSTDLIICCITKMDDANYEEKQYETVKNETIKMLTKRGYKEKTLIFVPICSLSNEYNNIVKEYSNDKQMKWYQGFEITVGKNKYGGKTFYDALNLLSKLNLKEIEKRKKKPGVKMFICGKSQGDIIHAHIIEGCLNVNDEIKFIPSNIDAKIKSLQKYHRDIKQTIAGDCFGMALNIINTNKNKKYTANDIIVGDIACDMKEKDINSMNEVNTLIFVVNKGIVKRIRNGYIAKMYLGCDHVACTVKEIKWKIGKSTNNKKVDKPMFIEAGDQAGIVLTLQKQMAISKFDQFKSAGRFVVVSCGAPVFFGKIC